MAHVIQSLPSLPQDLPSPLQRNACDSSEFVELKVREHLTRLLHLAAGFVSNDPGRLLAPAFQRPTPRRQGFQDFEADAFWSANMPLRECGAIKVVVILPVVIAGRALLRAPFVWGLRWELNWELSRRWLPHPVTVYCRTLGSSCRTICTCCRTLSTVLCSIVCDVCCALSAPCPCTTGPRFPRPAMQRIKHIAPSRRTNICDLIRIDAFPEIDSGKIQRVGQTCNVVMAAPRQAGSVVILNSDPRGMSRLENGIPHGAFAQSRVLGNFLLRWERLPGIIHPYGQRKQDCSDTRY